MKKLTLKKEAVSSLSHQSMARIIGGGRESIGPSDVSAVPCRCDLEYPNDTGDCITDPMAGCSMDCSVHTCDCTSGGVPQTGADDRDHPTEYA